METAPIEKGYQLRIPTGEPDREGAAPLVAEKAKEIESDVGKNILCRQCLKKITAAEERISVDGAHMHTFANPHGIVFEIGCFRSAEGCGQVGPESDEFTWFKGFRWEVAYCRGCLLHLGWLFVSPAGGSFYGLILDRLVET